MTSPAFPSPPGNSPADILIHYDLPGVLMRRAVRSYWYHVLRELLTPTLLVLVALSAAIFARGVTMPRPVSWLTLLAGAAPALLLGMVLFWLVMLPILQRRGSEQLARLPHHHVTVTLGNDTLAFATATERLEVAWSEVKEVLLLADFLFVHIKSGARLPIPRSALFDAAVDRLRSESQRHGGAFKSGR